MRAYNRSTETSRTCFRCKQTLPASDEYFYKDSKRHLGLSYECKPCMRERKKGRDRRPERYKNLSQDQKVVFKARQKRWAATHSGRATFLLKAYQRIDKAKGMTCDVTRQFLLTEIFTKPCVYCGTTEGLGCDRIDNSVGHLVSNIVPACGDCNVMRGDRFTYEEMLIIGKAVSHVRAIRGMLPKEAGSVGHL